MLAHGGLGITIFGVAALVSWEQERIEVLDIGETLTIGRYEVVLEDVRRIEGPNYIATQADLHVYEDGADIGVMQPEKRIYPVAQMPTTEAGIHNGFTRDVYTVIGDPQAGGGWAVRVYVKPFANWVWGGAIIMALGGIVSFDRPTLPRGRRCAPAARSAVGRGFPRNEAVGPRWGRKPHPTFSR